MKYKIKYIVTHILFWIADKALQRVAAMWGTGTGVGDYAHDALDSINDGWGITP